MKKTMRMMTAALAAMMCISVLPVSADGLKSMTATELDGMEYLDGVDMLQKNGLIYLDGYRIVAAMPLDHCIRFTLKDGVDMEEAIPQVLAVLETEYPGITERYAEKTVDANDTAPTVRLGVDKLSGFFEVDDRTGTAGSAEISERILKGLAQNQLISEYYSWGQIVLCHDILVGYRDENGNPDPLSYTDGITDDSQVEELKQYYATAYPTFTCIERGKDEDPLRVSRVRFKAPDNVTFAEKLRICNEVANQTGLCGGFFYMNAAGPETKTGSNAMEHPGDTNLDCEVDILDVIAANKHILGVGTLDKTGLKNADMNGDGKTASEDALDILKAVLNNSAE